MNETPAVFLQKNKSSLRFIDLFCGIGGFRLALEQAAQQYNLQAECVLSSDIDPHCQKAYEANFGEVPLGDISDIKSDDVPDHDLLLAGFPCQPFSIIGQRKGFEDTRGTLFFEIARILEAKQPRTFLLENVKMLKGHNQGKTLSRILETLTELGYICDYRILNALDFGLPQKRERIFIVGYKKSCCFTWPVGSTEMASLSSILERKVSDEFYASEKIRQSRLSRCKSTEKPTIWHENKSGNVSAHPYSCALRAGASYNYLLVNGKRRLTPREMLRLQGFPDSFEIVCNYSQTRKQAGNSLAVPVAKAILSNLIVSQGWISSYKKPVIYAESHLTGQMRLLEKTGRYAQRQETTSTNRREV